MCGLGLMAPDGRFIQALTPAFVKRTRAPRKNSFGLELFSLTNDKFKPVIII
jgi:hypothetical protein